MSVSSRFEKFTANLALSDEQRTDARTKYDGVCSKLHDHFYGTTYDGSTKLLVGSHGKKTNIRPPRDVDVYFVMPYGKWESYESRMGNKQSQLLQDIKSVLKDRYPNTDVKADGQVVVVPFSSGHSIELAPGWKLKNDKYNLPDTHNGGTWKMIDPVAEYANIHSSDSRSNGNTRNLICMVKAWQAFCNVPIKSLVLELRAVNFMASWQYFDKGTTWYDWMVRDFFKELIGKAGGTCVMPGLEEKIQYGDAWKSKAESAYARAQKACEHESKTEEYSATLEWKKIFGEDFGH